MIKRLARIVSAIAILAAFLALALYVGDSNRHATPIGWLPFLATLCAIVADGVLVSMSKRFLSFEVASSVLECQRGETIDMDIMFKNRFPLVIQNIQGEYFLKDGAHTSVVEKSVMMSMGPFSSHKIKVPMTFENLGRFEIGVSDVRIGDMLGLFTAKLKSSKTIEVRITPRITDIESVDLSEDAMLESKRALKSVLADSQDYAYVRDYVIGDPLKSIHWKLSARMGTYFTRLYEMSTNPGLVVVLDFYSPAKDPSSAHKLLDAVVEGGLSIAHWAYKQGMDIEIRYVDKMGETLVFDRYDSAVSASIIDDIPDEFNDPSTRNACIDLIDKMLIERSGQNNVVVCSANFDEDMMAAMESIQMDRRKPIFLGAVPDELVDRDRSDYCKNLHMLEGAGISCAAFSDSSEFARSEIR